MLGDLNFIFLSKVHNDHLLQRFEKRTESKNPKLQLIKKYVILICGSNRYILFVAEVLREMAKKWPFSEHPIGDF